MATVQKSSKINFYKFVQVKDPSTRMDPDVKNSDIVLAKSINTNTRAINNLGDTVNSLGKVLVDLKKVGLSNLEAQKKDKTKFKPEYTTPQKKQKQGGLVSGLLAKSGSFLEGLLGLFGNLFKIAVVIPVLKWLSDPKNQDKIVKVLDVIKTVVQFIFDWAKWSITTTIDGLYDLLNDDATWQDRLLGFGKAIVGIGSIVLGIRYLKNPTKIITDIAKGVGALIKFVTGGGRGRGGGNLPRGRRRGSRRGGLAKVATGALLLTGAGMGLNALNNRDGDEEKSQGGSVKNLPSRAQGGFIDGPQSGYKVSLDGGRSTSFIGHGREYVARKANGGAFVVPINTPGTKTQPHLTQKRLGEAKSQGYNVPGFAKGGLVGGTAGKPADAKNRKIFFHWSGGFHNSTGGLPYHQAFSGAGKPGNKNVNYGVDKDEHTAGHNTNSVALAAAAMGHQGMTRTYYDDKRGWKENPLTNAQTTAMAKEAAGLMKAYGQKPSDVKRNVWTHGEWERHAVRTGTLDPPVQRWDLDSLKPGPYNHPGGFWSSQQVRSKGGDQMRAKVRSFLSGAGGTEDTPNPDETGKPQADRKPRGFMSNALGLIDAITGGRTDFDGMSSPPKTQTSSSPGGGEQRTGENGDQQPTSENAHGYGSLLDMIGSRESDSSGGYDAVNQLGKDGGTSVGNGYSGPFSKMKQHGGKKLTSMTVGEVMALQAPRSMSDAEWVKQGRLHATGRYQIVGRTLKGLVDQGVVSKDDKYNAATQNKLGVALIKGRGRNAHGLKNEWIGLRKETDGAVLAAYDANGAKTKGGHSATGGGSINASTSSSSSATNTAGTSQDSSLGNMILGGPTTSVKGKRGEYSYGNREAEIKAQGRRGSLSQSTQERNEARTQINERTREMVGSVIEQVGQSNGMNSQLVAQANAAVQMAIQAGQRQGPPVVVGSRSGGAGGGGGGGGGIAGTLVGTAAALLGSTNNPLRGIFK